MKTSKMKAKIYASAHLWISHDNPIADINRSNGKKKVVKRPNTVATLRLILNCTE
jgi:hypothetical protein